MWTQCVFILLASTSLLACGPPASGYRDLSADYERAASAPHTLDDGEALFANEAVLELPSLLALVLERNPTLEIARQGWREALAQVPQATSFEDPMVGVSLAPLSIVDPDVKLGVGAELSQPLPYPGKRRLRGQAALAEADAARHDYRAVRQRLALMAAQLYYDYFLLERALAINAEHAALLAEYLDAVTRYLETGRAWQDDALKLEVDLAELARQRIALEADLEVAIAQLNALLHRRPATAIPAPPPELAPAAPTVDDQAALAARALEQRPELGAVASRERGARSRVDLAQRSYYPDLRVTGTYNRMWHDVAHQFMVGVAIELPLTRGRRDAAVDAAEAAVARTHATRALVVDDVLREVHTAARRVREADASAALYRDRVVPAAESRVEAVRLGLDAGRTTFIEVIRAERELRAVRLTNYQLVADTHRRRAELAWAIGGAPTDASAGGAR